MVDFHGQTLFSIACHSRPDRIRIQHLGTTHWNENLEGPEFQTQNLSVALYGVSYFTYNLMEHIIWHICNLE